MTQKPPPIGLRPREIVDEHRVLEILDAMRRYVEAGKPVPLIWYNELTEKMKTDPA